MDRQSVYSMGTYHRRSVYKGLNNLVKLKKLEKYIWFVKMLFEGISTVKIYLTVLELLPLYLYFILYGFLGRVLGRCQDWKGVGSVHLRYLLRCSVYSNESNLDSLAIGASILTQFYIVACSQRFHERRRVWQCCCACGKAFQLEISRHCDRWRHLARNDECVLCWPGTGTDVLFGHILETGLSPTRRPSILTRHIFWSMVSVLLI